MSKLLLKLEIYLLEPICKITGEVFDHILDLRHIEKFLFNFVLKAINPDRKYKAQ